MSHTVFTALLLPLALVIIMTSLGIALTVADFRRVLVYPKGVAIGLGNLLLISPALAFLVAWLFSLPPELAVGVVLLGAAPGGTMANMLTHLARGDTALAVTMTAVSSAVCVVTVPLFLTLGMDLFMRGEHAGPTPALGPIVVKILMMTLVPLSAGMLVRARLPHLASRLERPLKRLAIGFFVLVVIAAIYSERNNILGYITAVGSAVVCLNVLAMAIGYGCAQLGRLDRRQSTAVAIELGVHNTTLSMAVGGLVSVTMAVPGAVYGTFMFVTAGLFAWAMARRNAPQSSRVSETTMPSASA